MTKFLLIGLLTILVNHVHSAKEVKERVKRFSIFSVVQFPNTECTMSSAPTMFGTCYTSSECQNIGGTPSGNCASGFGVCCMIVVSSCGSTISRNNTYIQNPGFPGAYTTTGACSYTLTANSDICQIRLDFNQLTLAQPAAPGGVTQGVCAIDTFTVTSASSTGRTFGPIPPVVCGTLTGSHMYIETGRVTNAGSVGFVIGGVASTAVRNWKIRVTQIACGSPSSAPTDCLQYHTGPSGRFQSFNFNSGAGRTIVNQNYNVCFRQETGFCKVLFSQDAAVGTTLPMNFVLSTTIANQAERVCPESGIIIPTVVTVPANPNPANSQTETYCGAILNQWATSTIAGPVLATVAPFNVGVYSIGPPLTSISMGFNLMFRQIPC